MAVAAARQLVADAAWSTAHFADLAACDTPAEAAFQLRAAALSVHVCSVNKGSAPPFSVGREVRTACISTSGTAYY